MEDFNTTSKVPLFQIANPLYPEAQRQYEEELQKAAGMIPNINYQEVREQAAKQLEQEDAELYNKALEENMLAGNITPETAVAFDSVYEPAVRTAETSLETMAADNELSEAFQMEPGTAIAAGLNPEEFNESAPTKEILYNKFKLAMEDWGANGTLWNWGASMLELSVPFVANVGEQLPDSFSFMFTGKKDDWDKAMQEAWNKSDEEFGQYLVDLYKYLTSMPRAKGMDLYYRGTGSKDYAENVFAVLDLLSLGQASSAKAAGNVTKSTAKVASAINRGSKAAAIREGLPTAIKAEVGKMSFHNSVAKEMNDGIVLDILDRIVEASRATPVVIDDDEMKVLLSQARSKSMINAAPSLGDPTDFRLTDAITKGDSGEWLYQAVYGPSQAGDGGGFATEKLASNFAKNRMGLGEGEFSIYKPKGDGSGYYVEVTQGLSEDALRSTKTKDIENFTSSTGILGWFQRTFAGSTLRSSEEHARATEITRKATVITDKLSSHISRLKPTKEDMKVVEALYKEGHEANAGMGKYFTDADLIARGNVTKSQRELYKAYKEVNDTVYTIMNDSYVREMTAKGFGMDAEGFIVREVNPKSLTHDMYDRMVIMGESQKYTPNNISGKKALELIESGEYKLYEIHTSYINSNLLDYNYKLVPASKAGIKPLPRFVLNYAEGGPRAYQFGTYFIKAGRAWDTGDGIINAHPITLLAETNERAAKEAAEEFGKLWDIARNYDNISDHMLEITKDIEAAELKYINIADAEDLKDLVRTADNPGGILDISDVEYRPRVVRHGEEIIYSNGKRSAAKPTGIWDDPAVELVNNSWRFGKGRRSKLLRDILHKPAAMKSFEEMTARSIQKAANAGVMSDYKRYMESIFRRNYASVVDTLGGKYDIYGVSDTTLIKTAKILPESAVAGEDMKALTRAAKRHQDIYNIVTNVKTNGDKTIHEYMVKLSEKLLKTGFISPERAEMISEIDPSKSIRALHFSAAMGWWNSAQAWKQMLGTVSAFAMHPIDCTRAMLSYVPIRAMYRYKDTNPKLYQAFKKTAARMGMYDEKALEAFMDYMDEYGTLSSIKRLPGVDEARTGNNAMTKLWNSSYFFTEMGTNFNYGVTDTMAFMETYAKKAGKITAKDYRDIAARADDLYINMSRHTQSKMQKSTIGAWFTQWLSYPMRMMESVLNRRLTKAERLEIAAMQFGLWGVGGTLLDEKRSLTTYDWLTNDAGMDDDTASVVVNGFITYFAREAGYEVSEGLGVLDIINNQLPIYSLFSDNNLKAPRAPAANFVGILGSIYNAIHDLVVPPTEHFDLLTYLRSRGADKTLPTGLRNASKAAVMFAVNRAYNNAGEVVKKDATTRDAVFQLLGISPTESTEMYNIKLWEGMENDAIDGFMDDLKPYIDQINNYYVRAQYEDKEAMISFIRDTDKALKEKFLVAYKALEERYGRDVAERFARRFEREYLANGDENVKDKVVQRFYLQISDRQKPWKAMWEKE